MACLTGQQELECKWLDHLALADSAACAVCVEGIHASLHDVDRRKTVEIFSVLVQTEDAYEVIVDTEQMFRTGIPSNPGCPSERRRFC